MESKQIICICCPLGCLMEISKDSSSECKYSIKGNTCKRGQEYAINELVNPTRILTSTVKIRNAFLKRLPVRTNIPIPKKLIFKCMEELDKVDIEAPVAAGQVILENVLDSGVNIIASRSLE